MRVHAGRQVWICASMKSSGLGSRETSGKSYGGQLFAFRRFGDSCKRVAIGIHEPGNDLRCVLMALLVFAAIQEHYGPVLLGRTSSLYLA